MADPRPVAWLREGGPLGLIDERGRRWGNGNVVKRRFCVPMSAVHGVRRGYVAPSGLIILEGNPTPGLHPISANLFA